MPPSSPMRQDEPWRTGAAWVVSDEQPGRTHRVSRDRYPDAECVARDKWCSATGGRSPGPVGNRLAHRASRSLPLGMASVLATVALVWVAASLLVAGWRCPVWSANARVR